MANWEKPPIRIFKIVTFYLLKYTGGDPSQHDREVDRVEWFPIDQAISSASYPQEKGRTPKSEGDYREAAGGIVIRLLFRSPVPRQLLFSSGTVRRSRFTPRTRFPLAEPQSITRSRSTNPIDASLRRSNVDPRHS